MKLSTVTKYACLVAIVNAKKHKTSKISESTPSTRPMVVKVPTSLLVPKHIVLNPNVAKNANFVPLNPFNEDLMTSELIERETISIQPNPALALPSATPKSSALAHSPLQTTETVSKKQLDTTSFDLSTQLPTVYKHAVVVTPQHYLMMTSTVYRSKASNATGVNNNSIGSLKMEDASLRSAATKEISLTSTVGILVLVVFFTLLGAM